MISPADAALPNDPDALKAMLLEERSAPTAAEATAPEQALLT